MNPIFVYLIRALSYKTETLSSWTGEQPQFKAWKDERFASMAQIAGSREFKGQTVSKTVIVKPNDKGPVVTAPGQTYSAPGAPPPLTETKTTVTYSVPRKTKLL